MIDRKLIDYLPPILRDITEYKAILNDTEMNNIYDAIDLLIQNQFIDTCTEDGVKRWEKLLRLKPKGNLSLDDRKFTILTKLNERLPYTITVLKERLTEICGSEENYTIETDFNNFYMKVLVRIPNKNHINDVSELLKLVIPANINLMCSIKYNQHYNLAKYSHKELKQYTIYQIRNEILHGNKYN